LSPTKDITATERVLFSQPPLVCVLPAIGAMPRCPLAAVQPKVNENIAPKLKPVEKTRFVSTQSCALKRSIIAWAKATSSPPAFPQPSPPSWKF